MYSGGYSNIRGASTMIFHAKVYSFAEVYNVPALKEHAEEKFQLAINSGWSMDDFPLAISEVYTTTPEADRGLRDLIVRTCNEFINVLVKQEIFCQVLRDTSYFAADLVLFRAKRFSHCSPLG